MFVESSSKKLSDALNCCCHFVFQNSPPSTPAPLQALRVTFLLNPHSGLIACRAQLKGSTLGNALQVKRSSLLSLSPFLVAFPFLGAFLSPTVRPSHTSWSQVTVSQCHLPSGSKLLRASLCSKILSCPSCSSAYLFIRFYLWIETPCTLYCFSEVREIVVLISGHSDSTASALFLISIRP